MPETSLATSDQNGALQLTPDVYAHIINAQTYGPKYEEALMLRNMGTAERILYRGGKIFGKVLGAFVVAPPPDSVVIIKRRDPNPLNFGETTLETRGGFDINPRPGQLTFKIPIFETAEIIRGVQDQYQINQSLLGEKGIEIPGFGSLGLKIRTMASVIPEAERYNNSNVTPAEHSLMRTYTAHDGNLQEMINTTLPTIIYNIWDNLRVNPYYQEILRRAQMSPGVRNNPIAQGNADPHDFANPQNQLKVDSLVEGFQTTTNIFNITVGAIKRRLPQYGRGLGINFSLSNSYIDVIPDSRTLEFMNNLGQLNEAQVDALGLRMRTAAQAEVIGPFVQNIIGQLAQAYVMAQQIKSSPIDN